MYIYIHILFIFLSGPMIMLPLALYFILVVKRYSYKHSIRFTRGTVFISGGCYFMSVEQHAPISLNKVCKLLHQSQCDAAKGCPSGLWVTVHTLRSPFMCLLQWDMSFVVLRLFCFIMAWFWSSQNWSTADLVVPMLLVRWNQEHITSECNPYHVKTLNW